jgi:hypothetical protein
VRLLATFALICLALPAAAADRSEQIRLQYIQVSELENLFTPPAERGPDLVTRLAGISSGYAVPDYPRQPGRGILLPGTQLVPEGITAWTVDPRKNVLNVSGTPEAVARLKSIIRLVDIESTQARLSVRMLNLSEATLKELVPGEVTLDHPDGTLGHLTVAVLDAEQLSKVAKLPAESTVEMTTYNNRPLYVRWPRADEPVASLAAVVPRINGDRTVTLMLPGRIHQLVDGQVASTQFMALRRLAVGQSILVQPQGSALTVVVTVKEVLPQIPSKKKR